MFRRLLLSLCHPATVTHKLPAMCNTMQQQLNDRNTCCFTALWTLSVITQVSRYLDFTEARTVSGGGISWASIMQICTSPQTVNHASTAPLRFLQAGYPSCHPTNSDKALKAMCQHEVFSTFPTLLNAKH